MPVRYSARLALVAAMAGGACRRTTPEGADAAPSARPDAATEPDAGGASAAAALAPPVADAGALRATSEPPAAGGSIEIAAGAFPSGSTPGEEGRDPTIEPALVDVSLGAFAIDALPFPNDPASPPRLGVSIEEATRLCRERGARLCTELEWERACKGPDNDPFATGARWNAACEKEPTRCPSGFGVRALGAAPELTDSRWATGEGGEGAPVLRGGSGAPPSRRCAARAKGGGARADAAFRCCNGPPNPARIQAVESRPAFRKATLDAAQLGAIFAQVPELARIGHGLRFFTEGDVKAMTSRTGAASDGITFTTTPVFWSPEPGAELLVAAGRSKTMSFVVALWTLAGDRYRFGSAFLMLNDLSPVALAFEATHRKELRWTSCWGCPGEQGTVSYRPEDHRVVIVQQ